MLDLAIPLVGKPGNRAKFGFDCPVKRTREGRQPRRRSCAHAVAACESAGDETRSSKGPRYGRPRRDPRSLGGARSRRQTALATVCISGFLRHLRQVADAAVTPPENTGCPARKPSPRGAG